MLQVYSLVLNYTIGFSKYIILLYIQTQYTSKCMIKIVYLEKSKLLIILNGGIILECVCFLKGILFPSLHKLFTQLVFITVIKSMLSKSNTNKRDVVQTTNLLGDNYPCMVKDIQSRHLQHTACPLRPLCQLSFGVCSGSTYFLRPKISVAMLFVSVKLF